MALQYTIGWSNQPWDGYMGECMQAPAGGNNWSCFPWYSCIGACFHGIQARMSKMHGMLSHGSHAPAISYKKLGFFILCVMCVHACMCVETHVPQHVCGDQGKTVGAGSFLPHGNVKDQTQVVRLGNSWAYLPNHAVGPYCQYLFLFLIFSVFQMIHRFTGSIFFSYFLQRSCMVLSKTFTWPFQRGFQVFILFNQQMEHENLTFSQLTGLQAVPPTLQS